ALGLALVLVLVVLDSLAVDSLEVDSLVVDCPMRRRPPPPLASVESAGTEACDGGRSDRHIRSGSALTSSLVRPLSTDFGWSSGFQPLTAYSSCLWNSSHCSLPGSPRPSRRIRMNRPLSFSPNTSACSSPSRTAAAASSAACRSQMPVSHTITSPPPYWPDGMTPSKSRYSIGWSSTWIAACFTSESRVGPLGTAQLASTPSISNRRS